MLSRSGEGVRRRTMKKKKEIVLYVEDLDLVKQKKFDTQNRRSKETSLLYGFMKKIIQPALAVRMEK
jgi:hypothetical protein